MKKTILILSTRKWNIKLKKDIEKESSTNVHLISKKDDCEFNLIKEINPDFIFVVHWNFFVSDEIWKNWPTFVFHMTDLPFGRGGSPLQNLIKNRFSETVITAIKCSKEIDAGDIYLKEKLSLNGSAEEIYLRANTIIKKMILKLIFEKIVPKPQEGKPTFFKRRTESESNLLTCKISDIEDWYDHIRMLDAEDYPFAFLEVNGMKIEFRRASKRSDGIYADVKIFPKEKD